MRKRSKKTEELIQKILTVSPSPLPKQFKIGQRLKSVNGLVVTVTSIDTGSFGDVTVGCVARPLFNKGYELIKFKVEGNRNK